MAILPMPRILLRSLFGKPATRLYPVVKKEFPQATRGKVAINIENCSFCTLCEKRCPTGAIRVDRASKTWTLDSLRCITCNYCIDGCPKKCLMMENHYTSPMVVQEKLSMLQSYSVSPVS